MWGVAVPSSGNDAANTNDNTNKSRGGKDVTSVKGERRGSGDRRIRTDIVSEFHKLVEHDRPGERNPE